MLFAEILSNLEKLSLLVNCKSYRLSQRLVVVIHDSAAILTPVFESLMTMLGVDWVDWSQPGAAVVSDSGSRLSRINPRLPPVDPVCVTTNRFHREAEIIPVTPANSKVTLFLNLFSFCSQYPTFPN